MANGVQLATAYISLNVRTDGIKKQVESAMRGLDGQGRRAGSSIGSNIISGIRENMGAGRVGALFGPMQIAAVQWATKAGAAVGTALRTAIISGMSLGIGAAVLGVGAALTAGLARLQTMQQSRIQLSLKLKPEDITALQKQIAEVVTGTNVTLDEAMAAVPKAINSKMSVEATRQYVKDISDAAAATGGKASFGWLDEIFTQVRTNRALLTDEIQQLNSAGLDIRGALKDAFGWDDKTLDKNLKAKKVGIDQVQEAIQKVYGSVDAGNGKKGLAQLLGTKTLDGSIKAAKASLARIGANFISALVGKEPGEDPLATYAEAINKVTEGLKGIEAWITDNRQEIRTVFVGAKDAAVGLYNGVKNIVDWFVKAKTTGQDFGARVSGAFDSATGSVGRMWTKVSDVFGKIKTKISEIVDDLKKKFDGIFGPDGWFAKQFDKVAELVDKVRDVFGLGPATASAAAPGGTPPFNPGPKAPGVAAGQQPLGGSTQGLSSVPQFGFDANGNPLTSTGGSAGVPAASNATRMPYGLPPGTDTGGYGTGNAKIFPAWVMELANKFGIQPSTYSGHQQDNRDEPGYAPNPNNLNRGIDWVGPVENLQKFAEYLESIPQTMEQVIWQNPNSKRKTGIAGGQDVSGSGYYDDSTYASHGGNDPNNIHVHTRQSMSIPPPKYSSGGKVFGAGTGTSDSIPAMLSNGEHVLTAAEVKKMGGQGGVYDFRSALNAGLIPGFAPGGAVDAQELQDLQDNILDLTNQSLVAQAQFNEMMNNPDASEAQKIQARQQLDQALRAVGQAQEDARIRAGGGTPPDRSAQNNVFSTTDQLEMAQQNLSDLNAQDDVSGSQRLQSEYAVTQAQRERDQSIAALQGESSTDYGQQFIRSLGFIPANAGNTGVAGTSSLASVIGMGNDVVGGLIDTGASLAQTAVSAGVAAGTMGMGAAAGPAASAAAGYGIQLAASTAKRGVKWGFDMASIGADALVEQLMPFGAPRWLGYDYTGFAPQIGIQQAFTSTIEKMGGDAIKRHFGQGQNPIIPGTPEAPNTDAAGPSAAAPSGPTPLDSNQTILQPGDPGYYSPGVAVDPFNPNGAGGGGGGGSWAKGGHVGVYDNGGVLKPGQLAFNASRTPESILTKAQWNAMATNASTRGERQGPLVENLYAQDMQDAIRQLEKTKRRDAMQYSGRP